MTHQTPDLELLTSLALGELDDETANALRSRLASEPDLSRLFHQLSDAIAFLSAEPGTVPSRDALLSAKKLLRQARPGVIDRLSDGLRQIVAALDFDSRLTPAVAGIRGAGATAQVAYSCEEADLDLEIAPSDGGLWLVTGQIDADSDGSWSVTIVDAAGSAPDITLDANDGAFKAALPAGSYELLLRRGEVEIRVSPLQIP